MQKTNCVAVLSLLISTVGRPALTQNLPALLVVPNKSVMLVGETRTFRAVGKDGRKQQNVTWSVSSEHAAALTSEGDEATLHATEPYATVTLTAHAGTDSAEASVEIRPGTDCRRDGPLVRQQLARLRHYKNVASSSNRKRPRSLH